MKQLDAVVMTGDVRRCPVGVKYEAMTDPALRATVISHMIRLGRRPHPGLVLGFAMAEKRVEVSDSGELDMTQTETLRENVWYQIVVSPEDIEMAHALINQQKITFHGKQSQMMTAKDQQ